MKSKPKTSAESLWHKTIADFANNSDYLLRHFGGHCEDPYAYHLDHFLGAQCKRKINFVSTKVGEWAVTPIPIELHDVHSNNPLQVTKFKKRFESQFGKRTELWLDMINQMRIMGYTIPFQQDVIEGVING